MYQALSSQILTGLLQLDEIDKFVATCQQVVTSVDNLQKAGKIDNLQQVCRIFGCVGREPLAKIISFRVIYTAKNKQPVQALNNVLLRTSFNVVNNIV